MIQAYPAYVCCCEDGAGRVSKEDRQKEEKPLLKRFLYLATAALVASMLLAPAAMAQDDMMMDESQMMGQEMMMDQGQMMDQNMMMGQGQMTGQGQMQPLPGTGGLSLVGLSAIALLVSSGLVGTYAIRRHRRTA